MGLYFIAWGPRGETHTVRYVCGDQHGSECAVDAIREYVSVQWAAACNTAREYVDGDTVYEFGYTLNESDVSEHAYCWACGDLVSHGDGGDSVDRYDDCVCTADGCTWPECVEVPAYFQHLLA